MADGSDRFEERASDCYLTPDNEIALELAFWPGGADLDAFHDPESRVVARARIDVRSGGDAYTDDWRQVAGVAAPRVHVNGPYSGRHPVRTAERCTAMHEAGCEIVNLCPAAPGSAYWRLHVWPWAAAVAWLGRLTFRAGRDVYDKRGRLVCPRGDELDGNRTEIARVYYGPHVDRFASIWRGAGREVTVMRRLARCA